MNQQTSIPTPRPVTEVPTTNAPAIRRETRQAEVVDLAEEAAALKEAAHDVYARANRLTIAIRRHRRQSQLLKSTLASLRELQQVGS